MPVTPVVVQASAVEHHNDNQHCDQLEGAEFITAAYTQSNPLFSAVFLPHHKWRRLIRPRVNAIVPAGRDNDRIQPFYKLILFPFHGFW